MHRQYGQYRHYKPTPLNNNERAKVGVIVLLSLLFVIIFLFELNSDYSLYGYPSHREQDIKVIQLDKLKDIAREKQGLWTISDWKYFETLDPVISTYHITAEDIMSRRMGDPSESRGFWLLGTSANGTDGEIENYIRLSNFQYDHDHPLDVSFGLTFYLEGKVTLEIRLWSGTKKNDMKTMLIKPEGRFFNYGICNEILNIPFHQVHEIEIKAILEDVHAIAVIDKIVVAVGPLEKCNSFMYSMFPKDWCLTMGKRSNTVGKRQGYKL